MAEQGEDLFHCVYTYDLFISGYVCVYLFIRFLLLIVVKNARCESETFPSLMYLKDFESKGVGMVIWCASSTSFTPPPTCREEEGGGGEERNKSNNIPPKKKTK